MIAIVILAVIMSLIYGSISYTADSKEDVESGNEIYQQARWAMDKMDADLESAFISTNPNTRSIFYAVSRRTPDGLPLDEVHFSSFNHVKYNPDARESDQSMVNYYVAENPDTGLMTLYRREDATLDPSLEAGEFCELVDNVMSLELHYYDGQQWLEDWDTRDPNKPSTAAQNGEATPPPSEVTDQEQEMINTLPLAMDVGILVAGPRDTSMAFHTKIRLVLSTIDLSQPDDDTSPGGSSSGSSGSGSGSRGTGSGGRQLTIGGTTSSTSSGGGL